MNYWAAPGIKRTIIISAYNLKSKRPKKYTLRMSPRSQEITFHNGCVELMGLSESSRILFLIFDESLYIYCTSKGNKVFHLTSKDGYAFFRTKMRSFFRIIKKEFGASQPFTCNVKKTNSEFEGNQLFEVELPYRYKRTFFLNKYK